MEKDKKGQLYNRLIHELISRIARRIYESGQRLPSERELSEEFGLSRGTIRRSLAELEKMGAVEIRPQSGAFVQKSFAEELPLKTPTVDLTGISLKDVALARFAVESMAVELACENIDQDAVGEFQKLIDDMERNIGNRPDFMGFDMEFHELLVRYSSNLILVKAFAGILEYQRYYHIIRCFCPENTPSVHRDSNDCHEKIFNALKNRNKKAAIGLLKEHYEYSLRNAGELDISKNDKQSE